MSTLEVTCHQFYTSCEALSRKRALTPDEPAEQMSKLHALIHSLRSPDAAFTPLLTTGETTLNYHLVVDGEEARNELKILIVKIRTLLTDPESSFRSLLQRYVDQLENNLHAALFQINAEIAFTLPLGGGFSTLRVGFDLDKWLRDLFLRERLHPEHPFLRGVKLEVRVEVCVFYFLARLAWGDHQRTSIEEVLAYYTTGTPSSSLRAKLEQLSEECVAETAVEKRDPKTLLELFFLGGQLGEMESAAPPLVLHLKKALEYYCSRVAALGDLEALKAFLYSPFQREKERAMQIAFCAAFAFYQNEIMEFLLSENVDLVFSCDSFPYTGYEISVLEEILTLDLYAHQAELLFLLAKIPPFAKKVLLENLRKLSIYGEYRLCPDGRFEIRPLIPPRIEEVLLEEASATVEDSPT